MDTASETSAAVAFGRFLVLPHRRELLADGQPVKLGGRAFDVLLALIEARGAVVTKDALMTRVWADRIVEENAVQSQMSAVRMALGADRDLVRTVSGRGYQFIGEVHPVPSADENAGAAAVATKPASAVPRTNVPEPLSELIGRDDEIGEILNLAAAHRLVTLTGAGGIGKTRIALVLARELLPHFADGVWLAEFSPLSDPGLVPATVAAALGLEPGGGAISVQRVAQMLTGRRLLLVLDTCEHVINATAALAEAVLRASSTVHILATSREPLQVEGEWVFPVSPLAVPAENADNQDDPLQYGAVRLFIERARAALPHFAPDRRDAALIAAICRRVDGMPLAIELAASRVAMLGIEELATRLEDRLQLLTSGRRTALPRHRTLRATLDWSYELLAEPERVLLRRLAIFAGPFSLACAAAVGPEFAASDVIDVISSLLTKSLITTATGGGIARYRLLDTTRAYAIEKLDESAERDRLARYHAEYYRNLFERAEGEAAARPTDEWLADYAREIDNLRAALDWAFSPGGDGSIGVTLTAAAVPLWMCLSLPEECRGRAERALAALGPGASRDVRHEMKLHAAVGASLTNSRGSNSPEISVAYTRALEIAVSLDDAEYRLRALWGLWAYHTTSGRHRVALELAQRFYALAAERPDPNDRLSGEGMIGVSQHYLGDLSSARRHLEHVLVGYVTPDQTSHIVRFQTDQRVVMRVFLARVLWLQGFPDQATRAAHSTVEDARAANHTISLCVALAYAACPLALLTGDLAATEHYGTMLLDHSTRHALAHWRAYGRSFQGALVIQRGDVLAGLRLLRAGFDEFGEAGSAVLRLIELLMAEALGRAGQNAEGLAAIEGVISRSERTEEHWAMAELLRVKGELLLLQGAPGAAAAAEGYFRQALDWAGRQGALSWELRAATSLGRLLSDQGRSADTAALLQPVYDRFT